MESLKNVRDIDSQQKYIKRFLWGILIYSLSTHFIPGFVSGKIINVMQLSGLVLFSFYWFKLASRQNISNWYLRIAVSLLLIWELYIICHGFTFQYILLKENLFSDNRSVPYLLPLALFVTVNNSFFLKKVFDYSYKLGVVFLIAFPVFLPYLLS
ncbi:MAG: hypothetical protein LBI65_04395, partial [Candidatus Symbiothrix sp.]|nr:hypothetical protein [Candidatus Symbiothrix sp.]